MISPIYLQEYIEDQKQLEAEWEVRYLIAGIFRGYKLCRMTVRKVFAE